MRNSAWFLMFCALSVSGCGYNSMQTQDEQVKSAWSEVLNQYQRRADLRSEFGATAEGFGAQGPPGLLCGRGARAQQGRISGSRRAQYDPQALNHVPAD